MELDDPARLTTAATGRDKYNTEWRSCSMYRRRSSGLREVSMQRARCAVSTTENCLAAPSKHQMRPAGREWKVAVPAIEVAASTTGAARIADPAFDPGRERSSGSAACRSKHGTGDSLTAVMGTEETFNRAVASQCIMHSRGQGQDTLVRD